MKKVILSLAFGAALFIGLSSMVSTNMNNVGVGTQCQTEYDAFISIFGEESFSEIFGSKGNFMSACTTSSNGSTSGTCQFLDLIGEIGPDGLFPTKGACVTSLNPNGNGIGSNNGNGSGNGNGNGN